MTHEELWQSIEDRVARYEKLFRKYEGKDYDPDRSWQQCRTKRGAVYHGKIEALAQFAVEELWKTKSMHKEIA